MKKYKAFIDSAWVFAENGEEISIINPSNGKSFACIPRCTENEVDFAVKSARKGYENYWKNIPGSERGRYLSKISEIVKQNIGELAKIESEDTGKPLKQSIVDANVAARYFEYYSGSADKIHGQSIPFNSEYQVFTIREPYGVTGHIIPWNYPLQMSARSIAATLAAGNTMIIKPAEEACLSVIRLFEIILDTGLPYEIINLVTGYGEEAGLSLASHKDIDHICFTGSPEVGTIVQKAAATNNKSCTMELGGKSPQIIFADADLDLALPSVVSAIIQNSGQTCSAGSRVLIEKTIYDSVTKKLSAMFSKLKVGSSFEDLDLGPLISKKQKNRVDSFLDLAKETGLVELSKGKISDESSKDGFYQEPVLFGSVAQDNILFQSEIFGPVLCATPFSNENDAIKIANSTEFGLTAGVWTNDGSRQIRSAKAIRCGQVFINNYGAGGGVELPFGGVKKSGFGREKGMEALMELTVCKTIINKHN